MTKADELRAKAPEEFLSAARDIVESDGVLRIFAASEWDEISDDGKVWIAGIVQEATARACETVQ